MVKSHPKKKITLSPIHNTYFSGRLWMGLDFHKIKSFLQQLSPEIEVEIAELYKVANDLSVLEEGSFLFFSSSYDNSYRKYICDVVRYISQVRPDIGLIPNYDMLLAHENKGYQELMKKILAIEEPSGDYFGDLSDFDPSIHSRFPYVVKLLEGAMSSNVFLVESYKDLERKLKARRNKNLRYDLKRLLKNYVINRKYRVDADGFSRRNYDEFFQTRTPFIIQDYVKELTHDYKVLVFGDKYYPLKRYVRDNDFRASGSGKFVYEPPSFAVLDYCRKIYDLLNVPFVSLDIAERQGNCYLIEFQGIGFGPVTLENSEGYYCKCGSKDEKGWRFVREEADLERSYAEAIFAYVVNSPAKKQ